MTDGVRVLIVAPAPLSGDWAGGISNFVRSFVANMPDDFEVSIAGVADRSEGADVGWRDISLAGRSARFLPVARLDGRSRRARLPVKAHAMWGLLRARSNIGTQHAVVQVHAPAMDLPLLLRSAPIVRVVHNAPSNLAAASGGTLWRHAGWALRGAETISYRRAARVFYVDRASYQGDSARPSFDQATTSYLPNGVDTTEFAPRGAVERERRRREFAQEFGIPPNGPWLLFCGRLDRQKDPDLLIATFAAARQLRGLENAQLLIVGTGPLEEWTRQAARAAGVEDAAHFVGTLDHSRVPGVMVASDVLLLSSAYEATPFVALEALACGLPVVSTAVGDVPELVGHERTGWIAAEHSVDQLARGVAWAVAQPRDEIAARAAASMTAHRIQDALAPFYEAHRRLAQSNL